MSKYYGGGVRQSQEWFLSYGYLATLSCLASYLSSLCSHCWKHVYLCTICIRERRTRTDAFLASKSSKLGVWFNASSFIYHQMEICFSKRASSNTIHLERAGVAFIFTVVAIALIDASVSVGAFGMWNSIIFLEAWGGLEII